ARAERLRAGLLRGKALGIGGRPLLAPLRTGLLGLGEDARHKAFAEARERALDAADIDDVGSDPEDHATASERAASIARRMRRIDSSRPTKIASPTMKWPILSSTTSGIDATGPTVSKERPWPAWISSPSEAPCEAARLRRSSSAAASAPSPVSASSQ